MQLRDLGCDLAKVYGPDVLTQGIAFLYEDLNAPSITQQFRNMWTEAGDYLSRQYVGTDSTISRVTRDGKEGFIGSLDHKSKVAQRYCLNTLQYNPEQTSIDAILGKHYMSQPNGKIRVQLDKELAQMKDQYTSTRNVKVQIATWNINSDKLD
jgi:hypothetical protein